MAFKKNINNETDLPDGIVVPEHIGIIMDGNGRWAKRRGLPRTVGHTAGAQNFRTITRHASNIGVKYLTVYAFSTENWKRPAEEVKGLMKLFKQYLVDSLTDFRDDDVLVRFIGDTSAFDPELKALIDETLEVSKNRKGMVLNIAMNYGGRNELLYAVKNLYADVQNGTLNIDDLSVEDIQNHLYTAGQPDPDLIIRPGGEYRLSNFMIFQAAYAELYVTDTLWPDFTRKEFNQAILAFNQRSRRFGGV